MRSISRRVCFILLTFIYFLSNAQFMSVIDNNFEAFFLSKDTVTKYRMLVTVNKIVF